jgi:hypothetical protein
MNLKLAVSKDDDKSCNEALKVDFNIDICVISSAEIKRYRRNSYFLGSHLQ